MTTRDPDSTRRAWADRPLASGALRLIVFAAPIVASLVFIMGATRVVPRPDGIVATLGWFAVLTVGAVMIVYVGDRISRRFLPVIALFRLSLVFPDHAPSRFKLAMRRNTVRQLQRAVAEGTLDEQTPQEAAEHLLLLATQLNNHDRLTRGHTERVRAYSLMIGEELGLSEDELQKLHWAGLIHDVGKLEIPAEILSKTDRPTDEEWAILRSHPSMGGHLVEPLREWLGMWADAATQHHERWDGRGYPAGLAGEDISYSGRIVAVADTYDVITSARSYKPAHSASYARQELAGHAGTQFDPRVVRAFMNIGLGRLRLVMGPMSWLTQLPVLGQTSAAPTFATAATAATAVIGSAVLGVFSPDVVEGVPEPPPGVELIVGEEPTTTTIVLDESGEPIVAPTTEPIAELEALDLELFVSENLPASLDIRRFYGESVETVRIVKEPDSGDLAADADGVVFYTPMADVVGELTARVEVCDIHGSCVISEVAIFITPGDGSPVPLDDVVVTLEDTPVTINVLGNDVALDFPPIEIVSVVRIGGWNGDSASIGSGGVEYHPSDNASGIVALDYTVRDANSNEGTGHIRIEVAPVNDAPRFASGGDIVVSEDAAPQTLSWATAISAGSTDESAQDLRFVLSGADPTLFADGPTLSPSGTLRFTPAADAAGSTVITVSLRDDGGAADGGIDTSTSVTFRLKIGDLNDPPDAYDDAAWVLEDSPPVVIDVLANDRDIDGDPISVQSFDATALALGSLVDLGGGDFRFTPDPGASGSASFTYRITDGNGGMSTANVGIVLLPVNDAPTAADDAYDGPKNTDVFIAAPGLLGNDTDVDGEPLTVKVTPVTGPSGGSVTLNGNGSFRYTPDPGFVGSDSFTYRITDPDGLSSTATVSIEIYSVITTVPYYFSGTGSPTDYDLVTTPPPNRDPEADVDSDGKPGLSFDKTDQGLGESDPDKYQHWSLSAGATGLLLDGPVALDLYSTSHDFHDHDGHVFVWLHDCVGLSCTQLAAIDLFDADWNDGVEDWIHRRIDLGSITHKVEPGHALRLRVQFDEQKMWVAMSGAHPSGLELTLSGPA